jgi:hypothetical protein
MTVNRFLISYFLIPFLLFSHYSFAQFSDNFTDGDFTSNPVWQGSTSFFTINGSKQLQSKDTNVNSTYLSTPNKKIIDAEWQFWVRLNFSPSNSNFVKIYLSSDNADLTASLNGYFIRIGETGSLDGIDLYRQNGTVVTTLINGIDAHGAVKPQLRIKVIHRTNGDWELYSDTTGSTNFKAEGIANDNSITTSDYFGVFCGYTKTNVNQIYFDDFYTGNIIVDTIAPKLTHVRVIDPTTLRLGFNEAIDPVSGNLNSNFEVSNGIGNPLTSILVSAQNEVELKLSSSLSTMTSYMVKVQGIKDVHNNSMKSDSLSFYTFFPQPGDVEINEIFPDPSPVIGLPDAEFIEIFNTKQNPVAVNCSGWQLSDASTTVTIPDFEMAGNDYIILCNIADTSKFKSFGKVIGVTSMPTLNNDADKVILTSGNGTILNEIDYNLTWYHDNSKQDGGWSIERINPYLACSDEMNWEASKDQLGGTPGKQNSVYSDLPDKSAPVIEEVSVTDSLHLQVSFNKKMDLSSLTNLSNYTITPTIDHPQSVLTLSDQKSVQLTLAKVLEKGSIYHLVVTTVTDCSGNTISSNDTKFGLPEPADSLDVVINEILFNPNPNGSDFVEVYNRSSKIISLKSLKICSFDSNRIIKTPYSLSTNSNQFFPGEYLAVTVNKQDIENRYTVKFPEQLHELPYLPSFNDDEGVVGILNSSNNIIDKFNYSNSYHFKLIDNEEGVSLERVSPDYKTQDPVNWTSASSSAGYATPTYQNSHFQTETPVTDEVTIDPQTFSPDNDGFQDELMIHLKFDRQNYFGTITIFDLSGREVRKLVNNDLFGMENLYKWDGVDNNGNKSAIGVYIILFEISNTDGTTKKIKKTCTLAVK